MSPDLDASSSCCSLSTPGPGGSSEGVGKEGWSKGLEREDWNLTDGEKDAENFYIQYMYVLCMYMSV